MFDIDFYMRADDFLRDVINGKIKDRDMAYQTLEGLRNKEPIIYNIETTNACNMVCEMCPRTTMMTRAIETIELDLFAKIVDQIKPHKKEKFAEWERFVQQKYKIAPGDMSENHFFLYIISKVIQLHGYGDPLLDKNMPHYVRMLTERGFDSYFSCNPANINIDRTVEIFSNGLSYIKYSIESVDDERHKAIRGKASNFTQSYQKILKVLDLKQKKGLKTVVIITMLDLNKEWQQEDFAKLKEYFKGKDVYIYMKSQDQQWYTQEYHGTNSVHWSEPCKHPWMSMTIKSNGETAMCMEDFNNEIVLGNAKYESLSNIWNGEKYAKFRRDHIVQTPGIKCTERCDMKLVGQFVNR